MKAVRRTISTSEAPAAVLPYAQAVQAGDFLFLAGQVATDFRHGIAPEARVAAELPNHASASRLQAEYVFGNARRIMAAAGASLQSLIHLEVFFTAREQVREVIAVRNRHVAGALPCGTHICSGHPIVPGALFTLEFVGLVPGGERRLRVSPMIFEIAVQSASPSAR